MAKASNMHKAKAFALHAPFLHHSLLHWASMVHGGDLPMKLPMEESVLHLQGWSG